MQTLELTTEQGKMIARFINTYAVRAAAWHDHVTGITMANKDLNRGEPVKQVRDYHVTNATFWRGLYQETVREMQTAGIPVVA